MQVADGCLRRTTESGKGKGEQTRRVGSITYTAALAPGLLGSELGGKKDGEERATYRVVVVVVRGPHFVTWSGHAAEVYE